MTRNTLNRRRFLAATAAAGTSCLAAPLYAQSRELVIISDRGNPDQRAALTDIANAFGREAGVRVSLNNMDHEAHKTAIRNYLVASPPDINFWFSGERMRGFVKRGLFSDITDLVEKNGWADVVPAMSATTVDGRIYGLPTAGLVWGLWYRKDVFDSNGWTPPRTAEDFLSFGQNAREAGMTPIAIGTKEMWPAAGWFDHMNLRINGLDHHRALMEGRIAYTDGSLTRVTDRWAEQVKAGMFLRNETSYGWEQAAAILAQKKAAMMDLAGFIIYGFPEADRAQLRLAPFPTYDTGIGRYEDFSVDSIHIPSGAKNPEVARDFLTYFYQPDRLWEYLKPDGNLPARTDIDVSSDPIMVESRKGLVGVDGTSQYFDRDTDPDVAQAGLKGFQEFMVRPERASDILAGIERARARAYGPL
ncbi:ABC transporter substrate-binding protein [Pseudooceanicola sp. CBS1P-1]|uniref:Extracellular solute-binding protein n=1 Tax=Pseudooceanicola albus TaxID=2692189 RepID=A0A6L7G238_9RHOB|nr:MULTISPECIES: ABC transporter substrate-binding protein [Pseudooceanicola]MBT9383744.1 ABC transporter substrate-binding protein [Pseudooceanicola endophyticus]MXN17598.1 extracellular solute-binding protein [Pseudooceanicola albus]